MVDHIFWNGPNWRASDPVVLIMYYTEHGNIQETYVETSHGMYDTNTGHIGCPLPGLDWTTELVPIQRPGSSSRLVKNPKRKHRLADRLFTDCLPTGRQTTGPKVELWEGATDTLQTARAVCIHWEPRLTVNRLFTDCLLTVYRRCTNSILMRECTVIDVDKQRQCDMRGKRH